MSIKMTGLRKFIISAIFALSGMVAITQSSFAVEPSDNNAPMDSRLFGGVATIHGCGFANASCKVLSNATISTSSDIDWLSIQCGSTKVKEIKVTMNSPSSGSGDLDIDVYKPDGSYIGGSQSTTATETVNTSAADLNAVVLKVYGYSGATNTYSVTVTCN